jgi:thiamine biosynthesis lipoprotein
MVLQNCHNRSIRAEQIAEGNQASYQAFGVAMDTLVTIELLTAGAVANANGALERALGWFRRVEEVCSRFDPQSEVQRLSRQAGRPNAVSPLLLEAVRFSLALAEATDGAFDPIVGLRLERSGFNHNYRTGERIDTSLPDEQVSYRDVRLDPGGPTLTLRKPLLLDLGAVAKGLALDLAGRELGPLGSFCLEAGGDILVGGRNARGERWRIGIRDPNGGEQPVEVLTVADQAVCTSGDYERRRPDGQGHHLIDARTGRSAGALRSVTVVAPTALAADGLSTAAFVLGPTRGARLLAQEGVAGLLVNAAGEIQTVGKQRRPVTTVWRAG